MRTLHVDDDDFDVIVVAVIAIIVN